MLDQAGTEPVGLGVFIVVYVAVQVAIAIWWSRRNRTETDYFLAGRRLGYLPLTLSIFATWFGAETVLGSTAAIAEEGLAGARAEPFGYTLSLLGMAIFIAGPIRGRGYVTLADFFRDRFGPLAEKLSAAITIVISTIWAGAQLLAVAAILETAIGVPGGVTLFVAAAIVVFYCMFGGLIGDVATDVAQGVVLIVGMGVLVAGVASAMGGVGPMIAAIEPAQLRLIGEGEPWTDRLDAFAIPVLGSVVTQEIITRFLAARDTGTARAACFSAAGLYLFVGLAPLLVGLAGAHLSVPGGEGDNFVPALAREVFSPALAVIFTGALLSAVLSTVDSNLLSISSLISINLLRGRHQRSSDAERLRFARLTTAIAGGAALLVAMAGSNIYELIAMTSVFGQAGMLIAVFVGLRSSYGGPAACAAAIVACIAVNLATLLVLPLSSALGDGLAIGPAFAAVLAGEVEPPSGYFLLSVAAALIAYVGAAEVEKRRVHAA